jgi:ubiquinone/menaquinone biosynthesis C-methylase UbiE
METAMNAARQTNKEQSTLWNDVAGHGWVEAQQLLDQMFKPFEEALVQAIFAKPRARVLDVGCGTGSTTLAAGRLLGTNGQCVGIDISDLMIAAARVRAEREGSPAGFIRDDAQSHAFEPATFDMIISRFGVMFFEDPVRAFSNLRRAAKDNAELRFIAWRDPAENPFMTTAERAARPILQCVPVRQSNAPGQFAFADPRRVHRILEESGWAEIDIRPIDAACTLPEGQLVSYLTRLGPLSRVLHEADEQTRTQVVEAVRAAFDPYVHADKVRFNAACWIVAARAPSGRHCRGELADI